MGYYITDCREDEKYDFFTHDFLVATDEEMNIAMSFFDSECDVSFAKIEDSLPEDRVCSIYKKFLVGYIRVVQQWMNTSLHGNIHGRNYKPSEHEEAVRRIFTNLDLLDYTKKSEKSEREYHFYKISDEEVIEFREENVNESHKAIEDGLIPIGEKAFGVDEYEEITPVTVSDRKGFLFYCLAPDGELYAVPYHKLFATEKEAQRNIAERNTRRDTAIERYHLLDPTDDENLNHNRRAALEWLYYNQDPPKHLKNELEESILV